MYKEVKANVIRIFIWTLLVAAFTLTLSLLAAISEHQTNPDFAFDLGTILWWWIVTISTVGYGDIAPVTPEGRLFASMVIILGWVFFAILISEFNQIFRLIYKFRERGLRSIKYGNHVVIVGYSALTAGIIESIHKRYKKRAKIVLVTNSLETNPFEDVDFVNGDPLDNDVLIRANVAKSRVAFVLAEENKNHPDAFTLVIATQIERLAQNIYTIVEITDDRMTALYKGSTIDKFISHKQFVKEIIHESSPVITHMYKLIDETLRKEKQQANAKKNATKRPSLRQTVAKLKQKGRELQGKKLAGHVAIPADAASKKKKSPEKN